LSDGKQSSIALRAKRSGVASQAVVDELIAEEASSFILFEVGNERVIGAVDGQHHAGLAVVVLAAALTERGAG
jgi:hypothetical protein